MRGYSIDANSVRGSEKRVTKRKKLVAYEPSVSVNGKWVAFETHRIDVSGNSVITKRRVNGSRLTFKSRELARDRLKSKADIWVINSK